MKEIIYNGKVILDFSKLILSDTIDGIEFVSSDPGALDDKVIYLINTEVNNVSKLFLRFGALLFEIGEEVSS